MGRDCGVGILYNFVPVRYKGSIGFATRLFLRLKNGVIARVKVIFRPRWVDAARFVQFKFAVIGLLPIGVPS